jgi:DNA-binding NtrC family response regulator
VRDAALDFVRAAERVVGDEPAAALGRQLRELEDRLHEVQQSAEKEPTAGARPVTADSIRGGSRAIRGLVGLIRSAARCSLPVLIAGETGTGKELVARAIHGESRTGPFVSVNCAALPAELLEAELFGARKGAFTGAEEDRAGLLSRASGGTFFFDEIGDMPLPLQAKLLRVLDTRRVRPLGGDEEVAVDARYLFATNRDLISLVEEGRFRRDLYFRIRAMEIRVPSLGERPEDIPELAEHFRIQAAGPESEAAFEEGALRALQSHPWPGNVRELENVVTRLVLTCAGGIGEVDVRRALGAAPEDGLFSPALLRSRSLEALHSQLEREFLLQLHADSGRDLKRMAESLGITLRALYDRFHRTRIDPRDLR